MVDSDETARDCKNIEFNECQKYGEEDFGSTTVAGSHKRKSSFRKWLTSPMRKLSQSKIDKNSKPDKKPSKFLAIKNLFHANDEHSPANKYNNSSKPPLPPMDTVVPSIVTTVDSPTHTEDIDALSPDNDMSDDLLADNYNIEIDINQNDNNIDNADVLFTNPDNYIIESITVPIEPNDLEDKNNEKLKAIEKRKYVILELIETERDYVKDLGLIVEGYMKGIQTGEYTSPAGMEGKDKIVFGNIHQIYDWHRETFQQEIEKCLDEPEKIGGIICRYERRLYMYVKYCENKPKSEYIVAEYFEFFEEMRQKLGHRLQLPDLLIKPVQRIMKYQLLLKDILKYSEKAGANTIDLKKAVQVMHVVPKAANDMMNVGRLQGFDGKITAQGKLLLQDTLHVCEVPNILAKTTNTPSIGGTRSSEKNPQLRERRVFLFEQLMIFSEEVLDKRKNNTTSAGYIFKNCIKINKMAMDCNENECRFILLDKSQDPAFKILCQPISEESYQLWTSTITSLLEMQGDFLRALQSPIAYQKELTKDGGTTDLDSTFHCLQLRKTNSQPHSVPTNRPCTVTTSPSSHEVKRNDHRCSRANSGPSSGFNLLNVPNNSTKASKSTKKNKDDRCTIADGIKYSLMNLRSKSQEDLRKSNSKANDVKSETPTIDDEISAEKLDLIAANQASSSSNIEHLLPQLVIGLHDQEEDLSCTHIQLNCKFESSTPLNFEWFNPHLQPITNNTTFTIVNNGGKSILRILNMDEFKHGLYTCTATNIYGSATTSANIVSKKPR